MEPRPNFNKVALSYRRGEPLRDAWIDALGRRLKHSGFKVEQDATTGSVGSAAPNYSLYGVADWILHITTVEELRDLAAHSTSSDALFDLYRNYPVTNNQIVPVVLGGGEMGIVPGLGLRQFFYFDTSEWNTDEDAFSKLMHYLKAGPGPHQREVEHTRPVAPLSFIIDPGTASREEIAALLGEMSELYKMVGGRGIQFSVVDAREPSFVEGTP